MWEVGGYVLIRHHGELGLCNTLKFQKDHLDDIQRHQDILDQESCQNCTTTPAAEFSLNSNSEDGEIRGGMEGEPDGIRDDKTMDDLILAEMDRLLSHENDKQNEEENESILDNETEEDGKGCDNEVFDGFRGYLGEVQQDRGAEDIDGTAGKNASSSEDPSVTEPYESKMHPRKDAFDNHYVRIAHTNGIHHLGVVTCTCRGVDGLPFDLMYNRLVPASFTVIRTLFTTMAFDTF